MTRSGNINIYLFEWFHFNFFSMGYNTELLENLTNCAIACENCLDACLDEDDVKKMVECIRTDRDAAKLCFTTASVLASNSPQADALVRQCEEVVHACAVECEKHEMDHCQECAQACRNCEEACKNYLEVAHH
mgnify:CR=1 FL=1